MTCSRSRPSTRCKPDAAPARRDHRGVPYPPAVRERAFGLLAEGKSRATVARIVGCSQETLRLWRRAAEAAGEAEPAAAGAGPTAPGASPPPTSPAAAAAGGREPAPALAEPPGTASGAAVTAASLTAPPDPGAGLGAHEVATILDYKRKHPSMGPAQIRVQLKRFFGWRISIRSIAGVLRKHGFPPVHRGSRPVGDEHPLRFEAPHRNALWQLDCTELRVGPERRHLLVVLDDFSRFVVGHRLVEAPASEAAIGVMSEAIRRHGKPERVYTDRGGAFTSWRNPNAFEAFLEEQLIDHSLRTAHRPQGGGKVEAIIGTVKRELWEVVHFDSLPEAERALGDFFAEYNHRRAHMGIGGLTPADRFFGRWPEVAAEVDALSRRRQGALAAREERRLVHEVLAPAERSIVMQLLIVGDEAELCFLGRRIRLGPVVS